MMKAVSAAFLLVTLFSCSLGNNTQARFRNSTSSQVISSIALGSASSSDFVPGTLTDYFAIAAGTNIFLAQYPDGSTATSAVFDVDAGHNYTLTLSDRFEVTIVLSSFLAGGTITINGLTFTANATTTTTATRNFSIAGNDSQDVTELSKCIDDSTFGVPGVIATSGHLVSAASILATSVPIDASCAISPAYTMMVTLGADN